MVLSLKLRLIKKLVTNRHIPLFISATKDISARNISSSMSKKAGDNHEKMERRSFKDFLEHSKHLLTSSDSGPLRFPCSSALPHRKTVLFCSLYQVPYFKLTLVVLQVYETLVLRSTDHLSQGRHLFVCLDDIMNKGFPIKIAGLDELDLDFL